MNKLKAFRSIGAVLFTTGSLREVPSLSIADSQGSAVLRRGIRRVAILLALLGALLVLSLSSSRSVPTLFAEDQLEDFTNPPGAEWAQLRLVDRGLRPPPNLYGR